MWLWWTCGLTLIHYLLSTMVLYCDVVYRLVMDITGMETLTIQEYCPPSDVWRGLNWRVNMVALAETIPEGILPPTVLVPFFSHIT